VKLYSFPIAPNPTRVRLVLAEKAEAGTPIPIAVVTVNLGSGEQNGAAHLARNPLRALPVLELDDGRFLTEALAIIEYLDEQHPAPPLLGRDPVDRARVRELERIAELRVLWPVAYIVHTTRSPLGLPPVPEVASFFRDRLPAALRVLASTLADGRPFLAGDRVTIADCTLAAALQFGRFGEVDLDLETAHPHLAAWDARYRERPAARAVLLR
jgi:glutathione S-transferase